MGSAVPSLPAAASDSTNTPFNTPVTLPPLSNDTPPDGSTFNPTTLDLDLPARVWLPRLLRRTARRVIRREELWNGNRERWRDVLHPTNSVVVHALRTCPETRRSLETELARFPVARLRTQGDVDALLSRAARAT